MRHLRHPEMTIFRISHHLHDIEAERHIRHPQQPQPAHRSPNDRPPLLTIHRKAGSPKFLTRPGLYLDEDQLPTTLIPADNVDLRPRPCREIPSQDLVAPTPQIARSSLLTPPSQLQMRRKLLRS